MQTAQMQSSSSKRPQEHTSHGRPQNPEKRQKIAAASNDHDAQLKGKLTEWFGGERFTKHEAIGAVANTAPSMESPGHWGEAVQNTTPSTSVPRGLKQAAQNTAPSLNIPQ